MCIYYFRTPAERRGIPPHPPFCSCCPLSLLRLYSQYDNISDSQCTTLLTHRWAKRGKSQNSKLSGLTREKRRIGEGGGKHLQSKIAKAFPLIGLFIDTTGAKCNNENFISEKLALVFLTWAGFSKRNSLKRSRNSLRLVLSNISKIRWTSFHARVLL